MNEYQEALEKMSPEMRKEVEEILFRLENLSTSEEREVALQELMQLAEGCFEKILEVAGKTSAFEGSDLRVMRTKIEIALEEMQNEEKVEDKETVFKACTAKLEADLEYASTFGFSIEQINEFIDMINSAFSKKCRETDEIIGDVDKKVEELKIELDSLLAKFVREGIDKVMESEQEDGRAQQNLEERTGLLRQIEQIMEQTGGQPFDMLVKDQVLNVRAINVPKDPNNPFSDEVKTIYECISSTASEILAAGDKDSRTVRSIDYGEYRIVVSDEEHNMMFPEIAEMEKSIIEKYGSKEVEETMETIMPPTSELDEVPVIDEDIEGAMESIVPPAQILDEETKQQEVININGVAFTKGTRIITDEMGNEHAEQRLVSTNIKQNSVANYILNVNRGGTMVAIEVDDIEELGIITEWLRECEKEQQRETQKTPFEH